MNKEAAKKNVAELLRRNQHKMGDQTGDSYSRSGRILDLKPVCVCQHACSSEFLKRKQRREGKK